MLAFVTPSHTPSLSHDQPREFERERERQRALARSRPSYRVAPPPQKRPVTPPQPSPKPVPAVKPQSVPPKSNPPSGPLDINSIPSADIIKLLASLLQRIATANDALRSPITSSQSSPHASQKCPLSCNPSPDQPEVWRSLTTASREAISDSASAMSFHARNIPQISLESYLLRILKYCPTTNQVFISLLVYFDRMSKLATEIDEVRGGPAAGGQPGFTIDSYNVHRLVIAGVTVASKFFSDVFYTNSRYAKVGGLPQSELNQLELAFLLLNDFHLAISCSELQQYTEQLLAYGAETEGTTTTLFPSVAEPETAAPVVTAPPPVVTSHFTAEPEAEEDPSAETDDDNTIRPSHSTTCSETQSIYSDAPSYDSETQSIYSAVGSEPFTPSSYGSEFFTAYSSANSSAVMSRKGSFADDEGDYTDDDQEERFPHPHPYHVRT